jgi:hypothetical protein
MDSPTGRADKGISRKRNAQHDDGPSTDRARNSGNVWRNGTPRPTPTARRAPGGAPMSSRPAAACLQRECHGPAIDHRRPVSPRHTGASARSTPACARSCARAGRCRHPQRARTGDHRCVIVLRTGSRPTNVPWRRPPITAATHMQRLNHPLSRSAARPRGGNPRPHSDTHRHSLVSDCSAIPVLTG